MTITRRSLLTALPVAPLIASRAALANEGDRRSATAIARDLDQLHSLLVTRAGETVLAETRRGGPNQPANIKSVSKTIHGLLAGMAIDRGILTGPDQRVLPLLNRAPFGDARDDLTIGHLLSMTAGLESTSGANYGAWVASDDWVKFALSRDVVAEPGQRFIYSTGSWHILGAALSQASGMSLWQMARDWLGQPLDITISPWIQDPQGRYLGGNEMALTPSALARIGQMVLNQGEYAGERVVSADWLRTSWQPRARSPWSGDEYGYGWFTTKFAGFDAAYGRGYGGQLLVVVPSLDLSIAIISDPTRPARSGGYFTELRQLVDQVIIEQV